MEEGYRIPTIDEFVQGFEFEVKQTGRYGMLNFKEDGTSFVEYSEPYEYWTKEKVYWKEDLSKLITVDYNGYQFTYSGFTNNIFKPFEEQSYIDQGLIRVKI